MATPRDEKLPMRKLGNLGKLGAAGSKRKEKSAYVTPEIMAPAVLEPPPVDAPPTEAADAPTLADPVPEFEVPILPSVRVPSDAPPLEPPSDVVLEAHRAATQLLAIRTTLYNTLATNPKKRVKEAVALIDRARGMLAVEGGDRTELKRG